MASVFAPLFNTCKELHIPKGQLLIFPNEDPRGVHYIQQGFVKSYEIKPDGTSQLISIFGPNDIFPIYWSFGEGEVNLYYETICDARIKIKARDQFISETNVSNATLQGAVHYILKNYRFSQQRIQNLEYYYVMERVAYRLLFLAQYYGSKKGRTVDILLPCKYQDIAEAVNSSRDTVSRAMSELIAKGIVSRRRLYITINDVAGLNKLISNGYK